MCAYLRRIWVALWRDHSGIDKNNATKHLIKLLKAAMITGITLILLGHVVLLSRLAMTTLIFVVTFWVLL